MRFLHPNNLPWPNEQMVKNNNYESHEGHRKIHRR